MAQSVVSPSGVTSNGSALIPGPRLTQALPPPRTQPVSASGRDSPSILSDSDNEGAPHNEEGGGKRRIMFDEATIRAKPVMSSKPHHKGPSYFSITGRRPNAKGPGKRKLAPVHYNFGTCIRLSETLTRPRIMHCLYVWSMFPPPSPLRRAYVKPYIH